MMTDPARARRSDPGNPDVCPVFAFHRAFSPRDVVDAVDRDCRTAAIGCRDCKGMMADRLVEHLTPLYERRTRLLAHPDTLRDILAKGADRARRVAASTMERVRSAIRISA
jgi:tryptophanyl-tRNA synthetase